MQIYRCSSLVATIITASVCLAILAGQPSAEARSMAAESQRAADYARDQEDSASAVIPSPNQIFDDESDIFRKTEPVAQQQSRNQFSTSQQAMTAGGASPVPVYVSQYVVPESRFVGQPSVDFASSRSAAIEETSASATPQRGHNRDLKVSASYGQGHHGSSHHHGHYDDHHDHDDHHGKGYDSHGWLNMGAYTGKKGSFGWHADFPVGGKSHGYGK